MGDLVKVHEMYIEGDLCWGDGAGGVWATRSLAEDSHRLWAAEADRQTAAEEAARANAEAMTPTDAEQEAADAIRTADQDETFVSDWNKATNSAREAEQEAARKADILALHRASAAQQIHNAEIVAAGLDKPGGWAGHPTPPMLEDAARKAGHTTNHEAAAMLLWDALNKVQDSYKVLDLTLHEEAISIVRKLDQLIDEVDELKEGA